MSKRDKSLANWKTQPQPDATVETVGAILAYYFAEGFTKSVGAGSHQLRVSHPALVGHPLYRGKLSIPVKNGQAVKPLYLKQIVEAIEIVQEAERGGDANDETE